MLSNYPPGVTGLEPQISGYPESEQEVHCTNCDSDEQMTVSWMDRMGIAVCPICESEIEVEPPEPDPDRPRWGEW